ncbi:MAG: hypothetical protein JSS49_30510, partial [Planctomycetes bacterium]|nr:hypothetical protein [Planctomycetota bacterium]
MSGLKGMEELLRNLEKLQRGAPSIASAAVGAGLAVLGNAATAASPGQIGLEIGRSRKRVGLKVRGKVGLEVGNATAARPHGHFLALGTKYIVARHFLRTAFESVVGR